MSARLILAALLLAGSTAAAQTPAPRSGVPPQGMACPVTHPIKGNFTPTDLRERCIYHVPGGEFYDRTKPERCYSIDTEAVKDGCRRSKL